MARVCNTSIAAFAVAASQIVPRGISVNLNNGCVLANQTAALFAGSLSSPGLYFAADSNNTGIFYDSGISALSLCTNGANAILIQSTSFTVPSTITSTNLLATTPTNDLISGALVCLGGIGVAKNVNVSGTHSAASYSYDLLLAGSSSPAYTFTSDTDTGIYLHSVDQLGILTNNANKLTLSSSALSIATTLTSTSFTSTTQSTTPTDGAIVIAGSLRVAKNVYCAGTTYCDMISTSNWVGTAGQPQLSFASATTSGIGWKYYNSDAMSVPTVWCSGVPVFQVVDSWPSGGGGPKIVILGIDGYGVNYSGDNCVWIGRNSVSNSYSTYIGHSCNAAVLATTIGYSAIAGWEGGGSGWAGVAIGAGAQAHVSGNYYSPVCIGYNAYTAYSNTTVLGYRTSGPEPRITIGDNAYGYALYYVSTGWYSMSDENLKTNIAEITVGLDLIRHLQPITFKWAQNDDGGKTHLGFSYQRVKAALETIGFTDHEAICIDTSTPEMYGGVGQNALLPHILRALKEIDARVQRLVALKNL